MGTPIGFFSDDRPVDYPELNKCPDCETYFREECCPLCGKPCPEEYRAGNRKPVKAKKQRHDSRNGRVQFIPWYHSAWFIVLMLIFVPIVGLILLWQSDHARGWKIGGTLLAIGRAILPVAAIVAVMFADAMLQQPEPWTFPELPQEEYIQICETADVETLYRQPDLFVQKRVAIQASVESRCTDETDTDFFGEKTVYYVCTVEEKGRTWQFLVRDERQAGAPNLTVGDLITVYGEGLGNISIYSGAAGTVSAPGVVMFFAEIMD